MDHGWVKSRLSPWPVLWGITAILGIALGLRVSDLDEIPPGLWVDEAIEGLQAHALWNGYALPDQPGIPYPCWPGWWIVEAGCVGLSGATPFGIRIPAAVIGALSTVMAFLAGRTLTGRAGGLVAAGLLAGSFWHVQFSRMALPCLLAVPEGLVIGMVLLRDRPIGFSGLLLVGIALASSAVGYAASLVSFPLVIFLLGLRIAMRRSAGREETALGVTVMLTGAVMWWIGSSSVQRVMTLGLLPPGRVLEQAVLCTANWFVHVPSGWGYWHHYPSGAARFSPVEAGLLLAGLVAVATSPSLLRWQKLGATGWLVLAAMPEIATSEGTHLIRALPLLAPAVMLWAFAGAAIIDRAHHAGRVALIMLIAVNAILTGRILYGPFASDPVTAGWYGRTDAMAAGALRRLAVREPIALAHAPTYTGDPILRFHLIDLLHTGAIHGAERDLVSPGVVELFRDPVAGQPVLFLLESRERLDGRRHLGLINIHGLVAPAVEMLRHRRLRGAQAHLRTILGWAPDSATARGKLGLVEAALGRNTEARRHLEYALRYIPDDPEYRAALEAVSAGPRSGRRPARDPR